MVDEYLETSVPGIYAAGDIALARPLQRRAAAHRSQHYDVSIDYVGHAASWDDIEQRGDLAARDAALRFRKAGRTLAVATIFRGQESLSAELAMEKGQSP